MIRARAVALVLLLTALLGFSGISAGSFAGTSLRVLPVGTGAVHAVRAHAGGTGIPRVPSGLHDLTLTASNKTTLVGDRVDYTATVPGGAASYTWWWGDGSASTTTTGSATHTYVNPGIYYVLANATDSSGGTHDNLGALLRLPVISSYAADSLGNLAQISGSVSANTTSTIGPQAVIAPGGVVVVSDWIARDPTSPFTTVEVPTYALGSSANRWANLSQSITGTSGLDGVTVSFSSSTPTGVYELNFSATSVDAEFSPAISVWNNFTFTIVVGAGADSQSGTIPTSPNPGTLNVYSVDSLDPGYTLDPQAEYGTSPEALDAQVYQTLLAYNGSQAGPDPQDFVPDLAMCVPGSAQCTDLYGSSLLGPSTYTFVINPNDQFYNATTGAHWQVHPDDVAYSLDRECLYTTYPGWLLTWGWVLCQALLPGAAGPVNPANQGWDAGLHFPVNNTPANLLSAITVNDSRYCTSTMKNGILGDGCVTLNTSLSNRSWPEFLEFVTATSGGLGVIPCNWASNEGEGLNGWIDPTGGCEPGPPGSPNNPNGTPPDTAWDNRMFGDPEPPNSAASPLTWHALGSGPYALSSFNNVTGYTLTANPNWGGTNCQGGLREGCLPNATGPSGNASYFHTIHVHFESTVGPGLAAMQAGTADLADSGGIANTSELLSLLQQGHLSISNVPTIDEYFTFLSLNYSPADAAWLTGWTPTLPWDALQDLNLRQFLVASFPHQQAQTQFCEPAGIQYCFQYGGAIPALMDPYYPKNISWSLSDPNTNPTVLHSAGWWWTQLSGDGFVGRVCRASSPCTFPIVEVANASMPYINDWVNEIRTISGGALAPTVVGVGFLHFVQLCWNFTLAGGPCPVAFGGWLPDYFDPSDYTDPQLLPNNFWSHQGDIYGGMSGNRSGCAGTYTDPVVAQACQGTALAAMSDLVSQADNCALPSCSTAQRALLYGMAENIQQQLGISVPSYQTEGVVAYAPWIDATTLGYNPEVNSGSSVDYQVFDQLSYLGEVPKGYHLDLSQTSGTTSGTSSFTTETGLSFLLLVTVTGGSGGYHFTWNGLPGGCVSANAAALWCTPTAGGTFDVNVLVTDSKGDSAVNAPLAITVLASPTISSFRASPAFLTLGSSTSLSVAASGGIGGLRFIYLGLPTGCTSANATTLICAPTSTGSFAIGVTATDVRGLSAFASTSLTVNASASGSVTLAKVVVTPGAATISAGSSLAVQAQASGSNGLPLRSWMLWQWSVFPVGAGTFNTTLGPQVDFQAGPSGGPVLLTVNATYQGRSLTASSTITVQGPPSPSPSPASPSGTTYFLLGGSGAAFGMLVGILVGYFGRGPPRRTRDRKRVKTGEPRTGIPAGGTSTSPGGPDTPATTEGSGVPPSDLAEGPPST